MTDQSLMRDVARSGVNCLRFWQVPDCLIVSKADSRLPEFYVAASQLERGGLPVEQRNSGGTAVANLTGVLNISWIYREHPDRAADISAAFHVSLDPLVAFLTTAGINATIGEVEGAYCRGKYDLAVDGRKVAGTAQRVANFQGKKVILSHLCLNVCADFRRADDAVNRFYRLAGGEVRVRLGSSSSLSLSSAKTTSVTSFIDKFTAYLTQAS